MSVNIQEVLDFLKNPEHQKELKKIMGEKKKRGRPKKHSEDVDIVNTIIEDNQVDDSSNEVIDLTTASGSRKNKMCRRVSLATGPRKNKFVDNGTMALQDYENFDSKIKRTEKKISRKRMKYKVKCRECRKIFIVDETDLPIVYEGGSDGAATYICDSCIPGR